MCIGGCLLCPLYLLLVESHYLSGYMEHVFGFVNVPDLFHCLWPGFRKLVSAILPLLYSHLSKNVRYLYAARDVTL